MTATLTDVMELPLLRTAPPIRCQGDECADHLRTARLRLERTAREITEATAALRRTARRYVLGDMMEDMLEDLKKRLESLDAQWFLNAGNSFRMEVVCAEEIARFDDEDEDLRHLPQAATWDALRALSAALTAHAEAIDHLTRAEAVAARRERREMIPIAEQLIIPTPKCR